MRQLTVAMSLRQVRGTGFLWGGKDTALGKVQAQSTHIYGGLMHNVDWGPTLYSVGGGDPSTIIKEHKLDGMVIMSPQSHVCIFRHRT